MNEKQQWVAALSGAVIGLAVGVVVAGRETRAAQPARAWEYRIVTTFVPKPLIEKFNKDRTQIFSHASLEGPGNDGWELVTAIGDPDRSEYREFVFKRPK